MMNEQGRNSGGAKSRLGLAVAAMTAIVMANNRELISPNKPLIIKARLEMEPPPVALLAPERGARGFGWYQQFAGNRGKKPRF